ncbi:MAG: hypothetical protein KatS3mg009_2361 [Acidimicrobiia bacterium]|nr:MAG: hypothetical protein KatS3mg009_2361 [Acidimicrobiia bacterium]
MVSFRFHLVSLVAVFLAIGLGILVGSTVVDQAIVDRLDREIAEVRAENGELRAEIDDLRGQLARAQDEVAALAPYALEARLEGVPVAVLTEAGVDGGDVDAIVEALRGSGAQPTVVRLEDRWRLDDADDVAALRDAVDGTGSPERLRARGFEVLASRLVEPPGEGGAADPLARLAAAGFVVIDGDVDLASFPPRPARALVVTGTGSELLGVAGAPVSAALAGALVGADVPTVVGEVYVAPDDEEPPARTRGETLRAVREDDELAAAVSTVDDLEAVAGRVASVIALEDLVTGTVGHYGSGAGADEAFPRPAP